MTAASSSRPLRKLKCAFAFLLFLTGGALASETTWHLLVEPKFLGYESAWPIQNSNATILTPARFVNGEILPLKRDEILAMGVKRQDILNEAPASASAILSTLKPRYERDSNKVIQYAVLESDSPLTASAVLAPEFGKMFVDTLGPDLVVAIPSRNRIFVFSRQSDTWQRMSEPVILEYESSINPVSREVFEINRGKLIAIGRYR